METEIEKALRPLRVPRKAVKDSSADLRAGKDRVHVVERVARMNDDGKGMLLRDVDLLFEEADLFALVFAVPVVVEAYLSYTEDLAFAFRRNAAGGHHVEVFDLVVAELRFGMNAEGYSGYLHGNVRRTRTIPYRLFRWRPGPHASRRRAPSP